VARNVKVGRALLVHKPGNPDAEFVDDVAAYLRRSSIQVRRLEADAQTTCGEPSDIALSLGGDGTLLNCARIVAEFETPILPVNLGTLGFITEIAKPEWREAFERYRNGRLAVSPRLMVAATVIRAGLEVARLPGLNDAVISTGGTPKITRLQVVLSGTAVGRYRADGVILSTPTGSTAYSMAAGGPILHPEMQALVLNPVCPFTLSNRPLVVPADEVVEITVEEPQRTEVMLTVDGQESLPLQPGDRVVLRRYEHSALIIRSDRRNFYEVLRHKLHWAGEPGA
jgi:NAD+ kinase